MYDTPGGWMRLHRGIEDHWIWEDPVKLKWWLGLLFMANWEDKKVVVGNTLVVVKRGQLIASNKYLMDKWKVCTHTVRNFLRLLEMDDMITQDAYPKYNIITICNYDKYQPVDDHNADPKTDHSNDPNTDPNKECKNIIEKEKNKDANASSSESNSDNEVDYEKLIAYWNERTKGVWGTLINIKNNRLKMVRARVREHGKRALFDAINIACESSYLRGETWFNFDWLIKPNNFDKLIAGNYNHEQRAQQQLELNNVRLGKGEQIDNQGNRFYMQGRTKVIVPFDAEPRPSDSHYWSESRKTWYYNGM